MRTTVLVQAQLNLSRNWHQKGDRRGPVCLGCASNAPDDTLPALEELLFLAGELLRFGRMDTPQANKSCVVKCRMLSRALPMNSTLSKGEEEKVYREIQKFPPQQP